MASNFANLSLTDFLKKIERSILFLKNGKVAQFSADEIQRRGLNKSFLALGPAGCGKSASIKQLCKELKIGYKELRLVTSTETDLMGLPYVEELGGDGASQKQKIMMFAQNGQMPYADRDGEMGILVLDEITSASREVQAAALQLMDVSRGVGNYKLPPKWIIVALGNGEEDGGVYRQLPPALINRCNAYRVESTADEWLKWGQRSGINPVVLAFIKQNPTYLHMLPSAVSDDFVDDCMVFPSPRSWDSISSLLNNASLFSYELQDNELREDACGAVGAVMGNKFHAFYNYGRTLPDVTRIIDGTALTNPEFHIDAAALFNGTNGAEKGYILIQTLVSNISNMIKNALREAGLDTEFMTNSTARSSMLATSAVLDEYIAKTPESVIDALCNVFKWFETINFKDKEPTEELAEKAPYLDQLYSYMSDGEAAIGPLFLKLTYSLLVEHPDRVKGCDILLTKYAEYAKEY